MAKVIIRGEVAPLFAWVWAGTGAMRFVKAGRQDRYSREDEGRKPMGGFPPMGLMSAETVPAEAGVTEMVV